MRDRGAALLGICLGHQLRAWLDGNPVDSGQLVFGLEPVHLTAHGKAHWLFQGLPENFVTYQCHRDYVTGVGAPARLLAISPSCPVEAVAWDDTTITTQFHPEVPAWEVLDDLRHGADKLAVGGRRLKAEVTSVPSDYDGLMARFFDNFLRRVA